MKKFVLSLMVIALVLVGCSNSNVARERPSAPSDTTQTAKSNDVPALKTGTMVYFWAVSVLVVGGIFASKK